MAAGVRSVVASRFPALRPRRSPMGRMRGLFSAFGAASLLCCLTGCWETLTLRPEDAPAPRDYYREIVPKKSACSNEVPVLRQGQANRPYRELSRVSSTCYPGTPRVCERTLKERACELSADALLLLPRVAGGSPPGTSHESLVTMQARAVRWTDEVEVDGEPKDNGAQREGTLRAVGE